MKHWFKYAKSQIIIFQPEKPSLCNQRLTWRLTRAKADRTVCRDCHWKSPLVSAPKVSKMSFVSTYVDNIIKKGNWQKHLLFDTHYIHLNLTKPNHYMQWWPTCWEMQQVNIKGDNSTWLVNKTINSHLFRTWSPAVREEMPEYYSYYKWETNSTSVRSPRWTEQFPTL